MSTSPPQARNMIDIHMHLLPGVDDGAENIEMALLMMLQARRQGISRIIATPHSEAFHFFKEDCRILFRQLADTASQVCTDIKLYLGCEIYCETGIMEQVLKLLTSGVYPTMNGTNYVLMEFSQWVTPEETVPCVETLTWAGYLPIIAHMERYRYLQRDLELVNKLRELGALIQLNAYSLFDETDESIRNWARQLALEQKVDFLGTDAHRTYHRPPSSEYGLNWLYESVDQEYADIITWKNAQSLLCIDADYR